jgi:uncharacterized membrane protein
MGKPALRQGALSQRQAKPPGQATAHASVAVHEGPLPSPEALARYNATLSGAAERILAMAETDQRHRMDMERSALSDDQAHRAAVTAQHAANAKRVFRSDMAGQVLGWIIAMSCVGSATYLANKGAPWYVLAGFLSLPGAAIIKAVRLMTRQPDADKKQGGSGSA